MLQIETCVQREIANQNVNFLEAIMRQSSLVLPLALGVTNTPLIKG